MQLFLVVFVVEKMFETLLVPFKFLFLLRQQLNDLISYARQLLLVII
jgi:hypothetical protein